MGIQQHKYGAKRVEVDGFKFTSKAEARRYTELVLLQKARKISELELQPRWPIVINGTQVCFVVLDFSYFEEPGHKLVVEDVKGYDLPMSRLKRKLFEAYWSIKVSVIK